ncbi:MAG: nucleotidyltransferase family protein [Eubacterium sp.]|uniref:nucleotidyltransferase family protein n=1 Tax=Eubacterium sp. TaxID=142586 RepID=UPI0039921790
MIIKKNIVLDVNRAYELERIEKTLAENNIDYIFLKGSVSKKFYIDSSMRPMNDIDILFRGGRFKRGHKII